MPVTIGKKKLNNNYYYFARECQRVNGKPRIVYQKYLGRAEKIVAAVHQHDHPPAPSEITISEFGAVTALFDLTEQLRLVDIINQHAPKREQGLSIGHYMLIAAINRCVCPKSKTKIGDWFVETPLRRLVPATRRQLTSQRFWDNMKALDGDTINSIEHALTQRLVQQFNIDTRCLLFDSTNFFTFIDSFNQKSSLAQRGHSKEKRKDLRIVGLAILASVDFGIPLFHDTYPGNRADANEFKSVTDRIVSRYQAIANNIDNITIVFDKGNNSKTNLMALDASSYHFVGSLKLTQCPELIDINKEWFKPLDHPRLCGVSAFRYSRNILGGDRTVVITHNEQLFLTQSQSLLNEIRKRTQQLNTLGKSLRERQSGHTRKGRAPSLSSVKKQTDEILKGQYIKDIVRVDITEKHGIPELTYHVDQNAITRIFSERLGKTILFTDNHDWTMEDIVLAYRGQTGIEDCFRTMKNPHFVSWGPMYHWNDHNVRVHAFYCVVALMLVSLLQRQLHHSGIPMSIPLIIEQLNKIREVAWVYDDKDVPKKPLVGLSKMSTLQQRLFDNLNLKKYRIT